MQALFGCYMDARVKSGAVAEGIHILSFHGPSLSESRRHRFASPGGSEQQEMGT